MQAKSNLKTWEFHPKIRSVWLPHWFWYHFFHHINKKKEVIKCCSQYLSLKLPRNSILPPTVLIVKDFDLHQLITFMTIFGLYVKVIAKDFSVTFWSVSKEHHSHWVQCGICPLELNKDHTNPCVSINSCSSPRLCFLKSFCGLILSLTW